MVDKAREPLFLSEVAEITKIKTNTLHQAIFRGKLKASKRWKPDGKGGNRMVKTVTLEDVIEFVKAGFFRFSRAEGILRRIDEYIEKH